MSRSESPEPSSLLGLQGAVIKTEPMTENECDALTYDHGVVERIKSEAVQLLYADHEFKEEMVIGPTVIQRPKQTPEPVTKNIDSDAGHLLRCRVQLTNTQDELQCGLCGVWSLSAAKHHKQTHAKEASDTTLIQVEGRGPKDGVCVRGGECSVELRARATPHGLPHNPTQPEPSHCQPSSDASLQPCHSTLHQRKHSAHKTFVCHECHKIFKTKSHLVRHVRIHSGVKEFTCNVCDKKFNWSASLIWHKRVHSGIEPFACDLCDKKFTWLKDLIRHEKGHTGQVFVCDVCGKKFTQSGDLKRHKNIHIEKIPYACDICDKKFTLLGSLIWHKRVHSEIKPFACDVCDKKFTWLGDLLRHKKVHNVEVFACNVCGKKFTQSVDLKRHKKVHSGEKALACDVCDKKFIYLRSLINHKKVHS